jgi:hypothetical protein
MDTGASSTYAWEIREVSTKFWSGNLNGTAYS